MFVNSPGHQIESIHRSFFEESAKNSVFLHVAVKVLRRQLPRINKDKSFRSRLRFYSTFARIFKYNVRVILSIASFLSTLLLRQGIESNPGPNPLATRDGEVVVTTQNCRGLTDPLKLTSLLRKAYCTPRQARILCLQETHHLNQFILDNQFQGRSVVDNGERASKGTAILVPTGFTICMSKISGNGRWAMVAIKDQSDQSNS